MLLDDVNQCVCYGYGQVRTYAWLEENEWEFRNFGGGHNPLMRQIYVYDSMVEYLQLKDAMWWQERRGQCQ